MTEGGEKRTEEEQPKQSQQPDGAPVVDRFWSFVSLRRSDLTSSLVSFSFSFVCCLVVRCCLFVFGLFVPPLPCLALPCPTVSLDRTDQCDWRQFHSTQKEQRGTERRTHKTDKQTAPNIREWREGKTITTRVCRVSVGTPSLRTLDSSPLPPSSSLSVESTRLDSSHPAHTQPPPASRIASHRIASRCPSMIVSTLRSTRPISP